MVGQQLKIAINYTYLHLGIRESVMTYDYEKIKKFIPPSWIENTWCYLSSLNATVHSPTIYIPPQQENDTTIMDSAIKYLSAPKFHRINAVRLYLKLFYISDMSSSSGKRIITDYLYEKRSQYRTSNLK